MYNMIKSDTHRGELVMRTNKGKKRAIILTSFMVLILLVIGNITIKYNKIERNVVEAIRVVDILDIMRTNHPINLALTEQIDFVQDENAKVIIIERIRAIKAQREEEARVAEVNPMILENEEKALARKNGKVAYLTFDDGPSLTVTPQILSILDEYNIKATFFVIGKMVNEYPDILKKTYEAGHSIGNHSYSHKYAHIYKNTTNFMADINKAEATMKKVLGDDFRSTILRFPGGSFGKSTAFKQVVENGGYKYYDWNSLNGDAEGVNLSKERLVKRFKETMKDRKELIVLMHDTDTKSATVESLRTIIDYLLDKGYYFDVLDNYGK